ncbi:hypothetical protein [Streptomyces tubercidicus]
MHAFPEPARRAKILGIWSAVVSTSVGLAPTIGGVLVIPFGNMLHARFGLRVGNRAALTASLALSAVGYVLLFLLRAPGLPYWGRQRLPGRGLRLRPDGGRAGRRGRGRPTGHTHPGVSDVHGPPHARTPAPPRSPTGPPCSAHRRIPFLGE